MTLTEAQARTKWCPFARVAGKQGSEAEGCSYNRWPGYPLTSGPVTCVASDCMAWRPIEGVFRKSTGEQVTTSYANNDADIEHRPTERGFCGLAERDL